MPLAKKRPRYIVFPIDCMKGKAKKAYMNNGKVVCSNMYDQIENVPALEEVLKMEKKSLKNFLITVKGKHTSKALQKHWSVSSGKLYDLYNQNDVPTKKRTGGRSKQEDQGQKEAALTLVKNKEEQQQQQQQPAAPAEVIQINRIIDYVPDEEESEGLKLKYFKPSATGEKISNKILTFIANLDKETKYKVKFIIEEVEEAEELQEDLKEELKKVD